MNWKVRFNLFFIIKLDSRYLIFNPYRTVSSCSNLPADLALYFIGEIKLN